MPSRAGGTCGAGEKLRGFLMGAERESIEFVSSAAHCEKVLLREFVPAKETPGTTGFEASRWRGCATDRRADFPNLGNSPVLASPLLT